MKILAIESSCDETAAAIIEDGRHILSNIVDSQVETHALYGGVVPEIASRRHMEAVVRVTDLALREANMDASDVDAVAATCAPGLIGALLVGVNFGKSLAYSLQKPFIPVHHIRGHIAANYLVFSELKPPFLTLVASGGHSLLVLVRDYTSFEILGGTRDDAAGEAFDKVARVLGVGYPGGPKIDTMARGGDASKYPLPHSKVKDAPLDFSFSGLKTAVINLAHNAEQKGGGQLMVEDGQLHPLLLDEQRVSGQNPPQALQRLLSLVPRESPLHIGVQRREAPAKQILLGGEMVVERPGGDSRGLADIPDGHPVEAPLPHQGQRGVEDLPLGLRSLELPALCVVHLSPPSAAPFRH